MPLDLGGLVGQLGAAYINAKYAPTGGGMSYPGGLGALSAQGVPDAPSSSLPSQTNVGIPFVDVISEPPDDCARYLWDPRANCGAGKWIRKRRRRHRNLATRGDIKDLSALKGVLGQGKLLEVWIATHS